MNARKLLKWAAPLAAASMILTACGTDDKTSSTGDKEYTKIVAGTEATYAPFEYLDDKGNVVGLDADILAAIGEEMGIETEVKNVFDSNARPANTCISNADAVCACRRWCCRSRKHRSRRVGRISPD